MAKVYDVHSREEAHGQRVTEMAVMVVSVGGKEHAYRSPENENRW